MPATMAVISKYSLYDIQAYELFFYEAKFNLVTLRESFKLLLNTSQ